MGNDKERGSQIQARIRHVLLHNWDPIGVRDIPQAFDEYDDYVDGVRDLLTSGASEQEIADYLLEIEIETMGLPPRDSVGLLPVARTLRALTL